jgi:hypothetical protein
VSEVGLPGHVRVQSPACVVLLWCCLTLQPTGKSSEPLRGPDLDLTISVVYGIPMWCYQRHSCAKKHSVLARERFLGIVNRPGILVNVFSYQHPPLGW